VLSTRQMAVSRTAHAEQAFGRGAIKFVCS
jgi:hypothetical protein